MKKANKKVAAVIKKVAETMADINYDSASVWHIHQPKEPKKPKKISRK